MKFNYQVRSEKGEIQSGVVEASSEEAAIALLQQHKVFVTFLEKTSDKPFYARKIKLFERVPQKDIVRFARQLSFMFKSKIPLMESLQVIARQTKNYAFQDKILSISGEVEGGVPLSKALSRHPKIFSLFYISMVKSGEASGTLSGSLDYLADHLEREYHLNSRIKGAMIYPALILVLVIGVLLMMMYFVIPNLAKVLTETGQELPLLTRVVISLSDFFRGWWGLVSLLVLSAAIFFIFRYSKTKQGKRIFDRFFLRLPLISPFLKKIYLSRFAENLATLISGGLPITQALEITGDIVGNDVYKDIISRVTEKVRRGEQIGAVLSNYPKEFPPIFTQMIIVGEKTGTIDKTLMNIVDFYQKEVERSIENLLSILEPFLIIFLGLIVAGLMAAVLMPLYKMTAF